jgi:proteasome lid subunit RPN8/RPN11
VSLVSLVSRCPRSRQPCSPASIDTRAPSFPTSAAGSCSARASRRSWSRARTYRIGGKDLRRLAASLDSDKAATIVYHSHPRVGAYFSAQDASAASSAGWPVDYLVVDCQEHEVREARLYRGREHAEYVEIARYPGDGGI